MRKSTVKEGESTEENYYRRKRRVQKSAARKMKGRVLLEKGRAQKSTAEEGGGQSMEE